MRSAPVRRLVVGSIVAIAMLAGGALAYALPPGGPGATTGGVIGPDDPTTTTTRRIIRPPDVAPGIGENGVLDPGTGDYGHFLADRAGPQEAD